MVILMAATMPATAQWLNVPTKGLPRTKDGKPDLSAPAPRKPDGKPDLSGVWAGDSRNDKYHQNLAADFKRGEFPIRPWAEALTKERMTGAYSEWPSTHCLPTGVPLFDSMLRYPYKVIQEPDLVVIFREERSEYRQIFLDGRQPEADPNPTWLGYSVGRWDRDALVVDTTGFNAKTWLDLTGHPSTEALHLTERFHRRDYGHLDIQLTIDDPKAYTQPWTVTESWEISPGTELLEFVCNENERT
jgi:hypothetical protein